MKSNVLLTTLSSALALSFTLAANQAVAEVKMPLTGTVTLGVTSCGSYTKATFDDAGNLKLVGDWTCLGGGGETGGGETGGGETGGGETGGGETGGDTVVDASCGTLPKGITANFNHPWDKSIASNIRMPIGLKGLDAYSLKMNKPAGIMGFGNVRVASTANVSANRTLVVSDCPGSMKPAKSSITHPNGYNACVSVGIENTVSWTHNLKNPSVTECKLDPNKQYYINISHVSANGVNTCQTGTCSFIYDYNMLGKIQ